MSRKADALVASLSRHPELQDRRVLDAVRRVPRELFVPREYQDLAWEDRALPIGHDATISQPYVVAFMTQSAHVASGSRVLEIGTGSGYQAAILATLGAEVFTVEVMPALAEEARTRLTKLGLADKVHQRLGDGIGGWPEEAPFDAVIVTAAGEQIPEPLLHQLKAGGHLVIPLGRYEDQLLKVFAKTRDGQLDPEAQVPVRFVPMRRLD